MKFHNRAPRCTHGFFAGWCVTESCPHAERPLGCRRGATTAKRDRVHRCKCGIVAAIPLRRLSKSHVSGCVEYLCRRCAERMGVGKERVA
jgi:hypothetical protein